MSPRARGCGYLIGGGVLALGIVLLSHGEGGGIGALVFGLIIIAAIWLEPRYGRQSADAPAGAAVPTGERFIDDETGQLVEVWYNADTGERSYRARE
jgi:hypothetical protein